MIKKGSIFFLMLVSFFAQAQEAVTPTMADNFRQEGKIYVVITVLAIVFISVVVYLLMIERRLKKLEEEINNKK